MELTLPKPLDERLSRQDAAFAAGLRIPIAAFDKQTRPDQTI